MVKEGGDPEAVWKEILAEVEGDISLETTEPDAGPMYEEGLRLAGMAPNAVVKVPMTPAGLEAGKRLAADGIRTNVTLVFSPAQAILAAEIGAYCVSPFLGRLDDVGADGMKLLRDICEIYAVQGYTTNVLAASLRHPMHVVDAALAGADIATMPYDVFTKLVKHPLTDTGLERFLADWRTLQGNTRNRSTALARSTRKRGRAPMETMDRSTLEGKLLPELQQIAQTMGIEGTQRLRKAGLIDAIVEASSNGERPDNGRSDDASSSRRERRRDDRAERPRVLRRSDPSERARDRRGA